MKGPVAVAALRWRRICWPELFAFGVVFVAGAIASVLVVGCLGLFAMLAAEVRRPTTAVLTPRDEQVHALTDDAAPYSWLVIRSGQPCVLTTRPVAMDCNFWPVAEAESGPLLDASGRERRVTP